LSILALPAFLNKPFLHKLNFHKWMLCLFWVVMILFTIVSTKIVHYSSMAYLPLSFLAASTVVKLIETKSVMPKWVNGLLVFIGVLLGLAITLLPIIGINKKALIPYLNDPFAVLCLNTPVIWSGFEVLIGIFFLVGNLTAVVLLIKNKPIKSVACFALNTSVCLSLALWFIVPKIEAYSQRPAIEFWESVKNKDAYLKPVGYKSYAHYFYGTIQPMPQPPFETQEDWFIKSCPKDIYFMTKAHKNTLENYKDIHLIETRGGFSLYYKAKANTSN